MSHAISGDSMFQVAMEMEDTGNVFYEAVAAGCGNPRVSELCHRLAKEEKIHYDRFAQMRQRVARPEARPMSADDLRAIQEIINEDILPNLAAVMKVARSGSLARILDLALKMEQDSIDFYVRILPLVEPADEPAVILIVEEERQHVRDLTQARQQVH